MNLKKLHQICFLKEYIVFIIFILDKLSFPKSIYNNWYSYIMVETHQWEIYYDIKKLWRDLWYKKASSEESSPFHC